MKFWIGTALFALLGGALGAIGITVVDNPVSFLVIMAIAACIDLNASINS